MYLVMISILFESVFSDLCIRGKDCERQQRFIQNSNWQAFGYKNRKISEAEIQEKILEIDKKFDLIMITEYFEESLILVKEELCMEMEEVSYLSRNFATYEKKKVLGWKQKKLHKLSPSRWTFRSTFYY